MKLIQKIRPLLLLLAGSLAASSVSASPAPTPTPTPSSYQLTVKAGGLRQSFSGFGASQSSNWGTWQATPRNQMADMVYRDLKMNTLRLWITTGDTITVANMVSEFNTRFVASGAIADIKARGVTTLLLAPAPGPSAPVPASISDHATKIAELILQVKNTYGVQINVTGISNEPSNWTAANIVDCVKYLRAGLDSRGLSDVKIVAPEGSSHQWSAENVDDLRSDSTAWNGLYGIASHSYGNVMSNDDLGVMKEDKQWWMTEACDGNSGEQAEDENRASSILARFLCEMNHGADRWIFFLGLGQISNNSTYQYGTAYMMLYDQATSSIIPFLKYYYFKQALNTFDVGATFRKCVSGSEGDMFAIGNQNPAINAAAAYNPDGSWGINIVNDTGLTDRTGHYPATYYNVALNVEELANTPSMAFTLYRSSANNHFVNSGTVTLVNGQATVAISPRELVSLRSAATPASLPAVPTGLSASAINGAIALKWNNTIKATSWKIKRSTVSGGPYTTIGTSTTTNYKDTTAVNGTVYYYVVSAVNSIGESANSAQVAVSPVTFPWMNVDVGTVGVAGSYTMSPEGVFTTKGAGSTIGVPVDSFNLTYKTMVGDGTIIARLANANVASSQAAKVGLMMCETLGTSPKAASVYFDYNVDKVGMYSRTVTGWGGDGFITSTFSTVPVWLKLVRSGNTFTGYASTDGTTWTQISSSIITMSSTIYVGLVDCSRNTTQLCTATFDNVTVQPSAPIALTQQGSNGQVKLGWTASYGAVSYNIKRATVNGGPYTTIGTVNSPAVSYTDNSVVSGTNYYYVVSAVNTAGESASSAQLKAWLNTDVGTVGLAGDLSISASGVMTTRGAGSTIGVPADSFNLTYRTMTGDGTIIAKLINPPVVGTAAAKVGLMMCETLGTSPKAASVYFDYNVDKVGMYSRTVTGWGGDGFITSTFSTVPVWLKLVRSGNTFTGYASTDGTTWTQISSSIITMSSTIYVGLVDCSRNTTQLCTATFDNVTLS